jgi:branched-chain amino acid aminotransferase
MTTSPPGSFDKRDGTIWFDGQLVEWSSARIHVLTHGLHYASCVYEGERAYSGQVFKINEHSSRLLNSARILDMEVLYDLERIATATYSVLRLNNISDGYVRPVVWRGSEKISTSARSSSVHFAIACWVWPAYFDPKSSMNGLRLCMGAWRRPPPECSPFLAKASSHYAIATLSKHQAEAAGYDDALLLDWRGYVAEATSANIFFVDGNTLHTPRPDCFLDGITRQTIVQLASMRGYEIIERTILPDELNTFSEAFLTGTACEVAPIREIDGCSFKPGKICEQMMEDYAKLVRLNYA